MSSKTRVSRSDVWYEMHRLAKETGMGLYLEESSYQRKNSFTLHQTDENGAVIKTLIANYYTTREMYLALKAAREIYKAAINPQSSEQEGVDILDKKVNGASLYQPKPKEVS